MPGSRLTIDLVPTLSTTANSSRRRWSGEKLRSWEESDPSGVTANLGCEGWNPWSRMHRASVQPVCNRSEIEETQHSRQSQHRKIGGKEPPSLQFSKINQWGCTALKHQTPTGRARR